MKNLIFTFLTLLLATPIFSQDLPLNSETGKITYEGVVEIDGVSKADLYSKALEWFALRYNSANDVIQLKDEDSGKVIGKGLFKINYYTREPSIYHTISIYTKDGRYKYIITDLNYRDRQNDAFNLENFPKGWAGKKKLYTTVDDEIKLTIADLEKHMNKKNDDDNW